MPENITVILGHPDSNSFCGALAAAYVQTAETAGHGVRFFKLGEITFDQTLRHGYHKNQELEPDLKEIQNAISWAQHLVLIYPNWWGSMPALLKGLFDRILLPGYAFSYHNNSQRWKKLLAGRSAHAIITMDTPSWYYRLIYRMPGHNQIKKTILGFCGIKPVKITSIGPVRTSSPAQREKWLHQIKRYAKAR